MNKVNCRTCKIWRPISDFDLHYGRKSCFLCYKETQKRRREKNKKTEIWYGDSVDPRPLLKQTQILMWSQKDISKAAKVSSRRVRDWVKGKRKMSRYAADNLCVALEIPMSLLYDE